MRVGQHWDACRAAASTATSWTTFCRSRPRPKAWSPRRPGSCWRNALFAGSSSPSWSPAAPCSSAATTRWGAAQRRGQTGPGCARLSSGSIYVRIRCRETVWTSEVLSEGWLVIGDVPAERVLPARGPFTGSIINADRPASLTVMLLRAAGKRWLNTSQLRLTWFWEWTGY